MQDKSAQSAPKSRRTLPLHPFLFALASLLSPFVANRLEVPPSDLLRPLLVTLPTVGFIWFLLWILFRRDIVRSAVLTSALTFCFFAYGHMLLLRPLVVGVGMFFMPSILTVNPDVYLFPVWVVTLVVAAVFLVRTRHNLRAASAVLNVMSAALLFTSLLPLLTEQARPVSNRIKAYSATDEEGEGLAAPETAASDTRNVPSHRLGGKKPTAASPDIYFIVLDGYGRQDVLKKFYDFDNTPFVRGLEQQGFFVAKRSRANYNQTVLCLAAALGMRYTDDIGNRLAPKSRNTQPLTDRVDKSPTAAYLKARGYNYLAVTTGFPLTLASSADILYQNDTTPAAKLVTPYESLLINMTPLCLLPRVNRTLYDEHRDYLNAGWRHLEAIPLQQPDRKFVYVHLLAPHPPFVFGKDGEPIAPEKKPFNLADASDFLRSNTGEKYRAGYVDQIQHVNRKTLEAISTVLKTSSVPPIIVVMGDHGPRRYLDYQSLEKSDVRECFGNLFAVYLPAGADSARTLFGDDISAVNTFRLLFDRQFGETFPRLPDRSYYSMLRTPYEVTDVTEKTLLH
jgi:hypothetical protein